MNAGSPLGSHNLAAPISPPTGLQVTADTGTLVLNWTANGEADTAAYKVYYGATSGHPDTGTGAAKGNSPIDVGNLTMFTLSNLPPGTLYVTISAYDSSRDGHGGTASDSMTVLVRDTTLPVVTVTQPNGGEKLFTGSPYVIMWTAADNRGCSHSHELTH